MDDAWSMTVWNVVVDHQLEGVPPCQGTDVVTAMNLNAAKACQIGRQ